jgi:hypothetical protein
MTRKPADPVVAAAGTTVTVTAPDTGRIYTLRAPSFGEVGEMTARALTAAMPSDAIFAEQLRRVIEAEVPQAEREAMLAAVDAHEEAQDHLDSLYATHGTDRAAWDADAKREFRDAQRAAMKAQRDRQKLEWRFRDHAALVALRRHQIDARQREAVDLVALCVASIDGTFATLSPDQVEAMPAGDVALVAARAQALIRPTPDAEKN